MAVKWNFNRKIIGTIVTISIIIITATSYNAINKIQYQQNYQAVDLCKIKNYTFDMSKNPVPYWVSITNQEQWTNIENKFNWNLPNIDFEKEMFIIAYGSELKGLRYNIKEPTFKTRGKYIGFPQFKQEKSENVVFVYRTIFIPLMDTDVAGYSPDYRGKD